MLCKFLTISKYYFQAVNNMRRGKKFPFWKAFLGGVYLAGVNVLLIWLFNSMLIKEYHRLPTYWETFLGMLALPLYLWRWASERSGNRYQLWFGEICLGWYYGILPLLGVDRLFLQYGIWGIMLIVLQVLLLIVGVAMIILRPSLFDKLLSKTMSSLWIIVAFMGGGPTGGALLGMYASRHNQIHYLQGILAIAFSALGFIFSLGPTYVQWTHRPWAKDSENAKG